MALSIYGHGAVAGSRSGEHLCNPLRVKGYLTKLIKSVGCLRGRLPDGTQEFMGSAEKLSPLEHKIPLWLKP